MDFTGARWQKSSRSGGGGNDACVEIAFADSVVGVRDSKDRGGAPLVFSPAAWQRFRRAPEAGSGAAPRH
ncbi:DUF397 domain-containing protein [Actinophytocola sp.]|uniref:DUF397 domain-containing protein n=1 Tax=Actinophytocola sp. TaxID=1872138 RepID=UPI003D6AAC42